MPTTRTLNLSNAYGEIEQIYGISTSKLVTGEITATEMTREEMIAAGIDPSQNEHYVSLATYLNLLRALMFL